MASDGPDIVILDGHTANPGDVSWSPVEAYGRTAIYPRTPNDLIVQRAAGAKFILTNKVPLTAQTIEQLPDLQYVGVLATGVNIVDLDAARRRGVTVTNIPGYSTESTAQHAFALLLALTNHVGPLAADSATRWPASRDFSYTDTPLIELAGLTCGVVGFGSIGKAFLRRAGAFGMHLMAHTANPDKHRGAADALGVKLVDLPDLLTASDVISLHCPLTPGTEGLINADTIDQMRRSALLVNTGRGPLLDESAVAVALEDGRLGGVAVDVLSSEPPAADNPLLHAPRCLVTPHVAWATVAARRRLIDIAAANLRAFLEGSPQNVVS